MSHVGGLGAATQQQETYYVTGMLSEGHFPVQEASIHGAPEEQEWVSDQQNSSTGHRPTDGVPRTESNARIYHA